MYIATCAVFRSEKSAGKTFISSLVAFVDCAPINVEPKAEAKTKTLTSAPIALSTERKFE